jgi:hypothetical protein
MLRFLINFSGWLLPIVGICLFLSEVTAVVVGLLLFVTLPWRDLFSSTEVQLRLLLAMGVVTLGVGQFALISFLINSFASPQDQTEEEIDSPVFILPPNTFFTPTEKRQRRPRNKKPGGP